MSKQNAPLTEKSSWKERYFNIYNKKLTVRGEKYHLGETTVAYTLPLLHYLIKVVLHEM